MRGCPLGSCKGSFHFDSLRLILGYFYCPVFGVHKLPLYITRSYFCKLLYRTTAIRQKEVVVPPQDPASSPTHIVIKTNPLFDSLPSPTHTHHPSPGGQGQRSEVGVADQEVFYGQRKKIRKTKEQEMISAVMNITKHSKYSLNPPNSQTAAELLPVLLGDCPLWEVYNNYGEVGSALIKGSVCCCCCCC